MTGAAIWARPRERARDFARLTRPANARLPLAIYCWCGRETESRHIVAGVVLILLMYGIAVTSQVVGAGSQAPVGVNRLRRWWWMGWCCLRLVEM